MESLKKPSLHVESTNIYDLPDELLLEVSSFLFLPDLLAFAKARLRFSLIAHSRLAHHVSLKQQYRRLEGYGSDEPRGWIGILIKVLRNEIPPEYIEEVAILRAEWYFREIPNGRGEKISLEENELIASAARSCAPWITEHDACGPGAEARDMKHFLTEINEGDQDNALAILLPMLPNVHTLILCAGDRGIIEMGSLPGVVRRIARASSAFPQCQRGTLPLHNLTKIAGRRCEVGRRIGVFLNDLTPFMALPSVKLVECHDSVDSYFNWNGSLPKSEVREVVLHNGHTHIRVAECLARYGIEGPCTLRQFRSPDTGFDRYEGDWFEVRKVIAAGNTPGHLSWRLRQHLPNNISHLDCVRQLLG